MDSRGRRIHNVGLTCRAPGRCLRRVRTLPCPEGMGGIRPDIGDPIRSEPHGTEGRVEGCVHALLPLGPPSPLEGRPVSAHTKPTEKMCHLNTRGTTRRRSAEARPRPGRQGPYPERKATRYSIELQRYEVHTPPDHQRPRPTTNHKSELSLVMMLLGTYIRSSLNTINRPVERS